MYELSPQAINKAVQQVTEKALQTVYQQSDTYLKNQFAWYFSQENYNSFVANIVNEGIAKFNAQIQPQIPQLVSNEIQRQLPQLIANEIQRQLPQWISNEIQRQLPQWISSEIHRQLPQWMAKGFEHQLPKLVDSVIQQLNAQASANKAESQPHNPASGVAKGNNVHAVSNYEYEPSSKDERDFNDYVRKYNELQKVEGFRKNQSIEEFCCKWRIEKFKCINDAEKLQDSEILPRFKSADDGYFWAVPLDKAGYYMVLPSVNINYEWSRHNTMGFKEAFKSGYTSGAFNFSPRKPAVFRKDSNTWTIVRKGELRLDPM